MRPFILVCALALHAPAALAQAAPPSAADFVAASSCHLTSVLKLLETNRRPGTATNTGLVLAAANAPQRYARCTFMNRSTSLLCEVPTGWLAARPPRSDRFRARDRELGEFAPHGFTSDPQGGDHRRLFSSAKADLPIETIARWLLTVMGSVYGVRRGEDLDIRIAGAEMTLLASLLPLDCAPE
jgi:hypothetical protein